MCQVRYQRERFIARCLYGRHELAVFALVILLLLRMLMTRRSVLMRQAIGDTLRAGAENRQE